MGGSSSKPSEPEAPPIPKKQPAPKKVAPKPAEPKPLSLSLLPKEIADPGPEDPCGLFLEGLNFHWRGDQFEKFLQRNGVTYQRALKKKTQYTGTIYFDNNKDRRDAFHILSGLRDGNRVIFCVPLYRNMKRTTEEAKRLRARAGSDLENQDIRDKVTPWFRIDYPEQLRQKALKFNETISPIIPRGSPLIEIVPAPDPNNPRNKIELSIGHDIHGEPCIGFVLGSRLQDVIAPIDECKNVPSFTPAFCKKMLDYIKESGVPIFDNSTHEGLWKYLLIRTGDDNQILLSVVTFGKCPEELYPSITALFKDDVTSLSIIETDKVEGYGNYNTIQLSGPPTIVAHLRGLKFDVSPVSFFQTNTPGAELLFQKIEELAEVDKNTVIIDVCCGTGVIGLSMARRAKAIVGVDIEESAIKDARINAKANGINNAEFIAAPAQDVMDDILERYAVPCNRVVCIVDPPRDGLHKKAAKAIRDCPMIKRLVYVSCNCDSLVRDSQKILMSPEYHATPQFQPTRWFGVDMFPHTPRCEILMLMERE